jgi:hypothetical protein
MWVIKRSFENFKAYSTLNGECQKFSPIGERGLIFFRQSEFFFTKTGKLVKKKNAGGEVSSDSL